MVKNQIERRGVTDPKVLEAVRKVPRHQFVPEDMKSSAYLDEPLPIGQGQTISQPYIVAYMTESLNLKGGEKVLEIGTGSGYQAAVLAEIAAEVYTVDLLKELTEKARAILDNLGYRNIFFRTGDGSKGWKEYAPYDAVIVTAAPASVPEELKRQMKDSGRMVIPVGTTMQELILISKEGTSYKKKDLLPVRFVPLISSH